MEDFQEQNELNKTLKRFNKIRLYHTHGWMNILPMKYLKKNPQRYNQIQLNTDTHFNAIIMDIDDEELLTEWNAVGLPTPTIQTLNKHNDKAHLVWLLNVPVSKKNRKASKYYKDIVNSIKQLIGADKAYQNHQTKNFLNEELYRTTYNDVAYDLGDFQAFIIKDEKYQDNLSELQSTGSRHIDLFNELRRYGYTIAKNKNLQEKLEKRAELINEQFDEPIKPKSIVKSVYQFCHENSNNFKSAAKAQAGVMKFKKIKNLSQEQYKNEVHKRQSKSAVRTADIKRLKASVRIKVTVETLLRKKIKLTYANIAKHAKMALRTVKNHTKIVKFFTQKINGAISSIRVIALGAGGACTLPLKCFFNEVMWAESLNLKTKGDKRCQVHLISG
ncbi:MAG: replication initiation protein [Sulfurimonas sp.]|uniref:replication initiation protein n=1 Tax=Sulfurimonas sp. TaxID=2022749 RepID=UPI002607B185|nr:replication initiation protein [Sulfurimonas sp.]MDD2653020.1 replication initiation protein [Sulfurimonas sp.]MDD3452466.1 replication initiation protein [Sulfurimonas sp.]